MIKTIHGEIEIEREYHRCRECKYVEMPLDDALEISGLPHKMTINCMLEVAFYGQNQSSFRRASEMIEKVMKMDISDESVRIVTEMIGKKVHENDTIRAQQTIDNMSNITTAIPPKKMTLYIMTDGASVNTRVEDLNGSTWRENKTVMVFTDKNMIRRKDGSRMIVQKEYAAFIGTAEEFKKYVFDLAIRNGYGVVDKVVVLADGATWIRNMCLELFPDAIQILDLFHLKENVYDYAKFKFSNDVSKYTPWAESINVKLENGKVVEVLAELPENETLPPNVTNLRTYLENNRSKVDYPEYKRNGFFVGSGAIESANKTIVQLRLKQPGMRWGVTGAQSILTLRAKQESGLWNKEVRTSVTSSFQMKRA